ncbi:MAG TPA: fumarylacetoacetate hydrolase family protein [Alphaproteobacteria bacterium]|nr:fumarylacetoacetate hydrolase family protein [Alphaproteobacteria bacterium]
MKLTSFARGGAPSWGAVVDGGIVDLGKAMGGKYPTLRSAIEGNALKEAAAAADGASPDASLDEVTLLPVIPDPDKILCVGLNYKSHIEETGRSDSDYPTIFTRFTNTQVGHGQPMIRPKDSDNYDYEGELALIIGTGGRHISEADALKHIAGYSCYNDGSIRDWQRHTSQFTPGKNFPGTGGFGPWMVTADEIPDPASMHLMTRLNGEVMQDATTDLLVFTVPVLIHYISTFTELVPGDVIVTGTPGGVGFKRNPPVFMKDGDTVEIEIDKIGILSNPIADE